MGTALRKESEFEPLMELFISEMIRRVPKADLRNHFWVGLQTLEAMIAEGSGSNASVVPNAKALKIVVINEGYTYGWYKEGVGLISVDPKHRGAVVDVHLGGLSARL